MIWATTQPVHTAVTAGALVRYPPQAAQNKSPGQIQHEQLTNAAQKWVAETFFGTLLKQMHNSPFKSELFSGGRGGEAFSSLYDQHLADRMARASGRRLADSIVKRIEKGHSALGGGPPAVE
jgi:Rod binding domain-containing protein